MCIHGVSYQAPRPPVVLLSPNLFSLYETAGGLSAVSSELSKHVARGFRFRAEHRALPCLPFTSEPVGCAERKDDVLRPRVLCDSGAPRNTLHTHDTGELVPSRNECAGPMRHQPGEANPKWHTEAKPKLEDAAVNLAVLGHLAALCETTPLVFTFDFKYFFHQFVLAAHELAASGSLVPERAREGGAPDTLVAVATSVMAMGVAPASNVAQDLANALMHRLLMCFDAASAPHVARLRRKHPSSTRLGARGSSSRTTRTARKPASPAPSTIPTTPSSPQWARSRATCSCANSRT